MAVSSMVMLMVFCTSVLQVDGYSFTQSYKLQKVLESALMTDETLYSMRQIYFPVVHSHAQEVQQVPIFVCVHITVDQALNSTPNSSSIPSDLESTNADDTHNSTCRVSDLKLADANDTDNRTTVCWNFQWTDSALLSVITIDQLLAFDAFSNIIYKTATRVTYDSSHIKASLSLTCPDKPKISVIKTSLMLLLSWSKSYVRHNGVPPQWDESDKGYIQELYDGRYLAESTYSNNDGPHLVRVGLIISFIHLNILVLMGVLFYGKKCYIKVHGIVSGSTRLVAVTWALMITALLINSVYLLGTLLGYANTKYPHPRIIACLISESDWCASIKSTKLYSDEIASILVKLIVVSLTLVVELISAVRLTRHNLLPFPCTMNTTSHCCCFRNGKRVIETILIWNVKVFIQIIFGIVLLPVGILAVIAPVATISCISTILIVAPVMIALLIVYIILQWCNPFSFKQCYSISFCAHILTAVVSMSLTVMVLMLYYYLIQLGVKPWSVKGSILSLLPSLLVTPLLWFAKRHLFKKDRAAEEVEQSGISMTVRRQSTAYSENTEEQEKEEDKEEDANEEISLI